MQTFLPYADFERVAYVLDGKRLNNQVTEALTTLKACTGVIDSWQHHPVTLMWKGHEKLLAYYIRCMAWECRERWQNIEVFWNRVEAICDLVGSGHWHSWQYMSRPWWLGQESLHRSHRQALLAKDYDRYGVYWPDEEPKIEYVWPVRFVEGAVRYFPDTLGD